MSLLGAKKETPCPDCGEMVRTNALRCWNCGAFMSRDVEAKYLQMQANPAPMLFSEVPAAEIHAYESADDVDDSAGDEDDFQLTVANPVVMTTPAGAKPAPSAAGKAPVAETKAESAPAAAVATPAEAPPQADSGGSDSLLGIAMQELAEARNRRKRKGAPVGGLRTPGGGLIIYCPYGCKIEVKEQHRGMQGKCPKCQAPFLVPIDPPIYKKTKAAEVAEESTGIAGKFTNWINDLHLHVVSPEKLKLKADSLLKDFIEADVGFSSTQLLVASLQKKAGGLFGGGGKKVDVRSAMYQHLKSGAPAADAPVGDKYLFSSEDAKQLKVVQPAASRTDNIFHGIPVFGTGRIAVQLPYSEQSKSPLYLSMGITEYWELRKAMQEKFGIADFGAEAGLPKEAATKDYFCHYSATKFKALDGIDLYKADPKAKLVTVGYRCGACNLAVSEAGREKANLGGKGGKAIAKTKCPKCSNKMGDNPLMALKTDDAAPGTGAAAPGSAPGASPGPAGTPPVPPAPVAAGGKPS